MATAALPRPRSALSLCRQFLPLCWLLYLLFSPIYVFESGNPQPADILLAVIILVVFTGYTVQLPVFINLYLFGSLFLGYIALVNFFWYSQYPESDFFIFSTLYYSYNFCAFVAVVALYRKYGDSLGQMMRLVFIIAVVAQVGLIMFMPREITELGDTGYSRSLGTFNNPNQLGYWGLLVASCYMVIRKDRPLGLADMVMIVSVSCVVLLSLSKAAMLSVLMLFVVAWFSLGVTRTSGFLLAAILLIGGGVVLVDSAVLLDQVGGTFLENAFDRLEGIGTQEDDTLAERGYDRLWLYPQYLILGAGEGAFDRFSKSAMLSEMHSTPGTVVFCYGLVGTILFLALLWQIFRHGPVRHILYLLPLIAYGLTHQGLRATLFWVFLALCFAVVQERRERRAWRTEPVPGRPPGRR